MISGKYEKVFRSKGVDEIDVLCNRVRGSSVNIQIGIGFFTRRKYIDPAVLCVKSPTAACRNVAVQKDGFVLSQNPNRINAAVCTVAQREIDDTVFSAI